MLLGRAGLRKAYLQLEHLLFRHPEHPPPDEPGMEEAGFCTPLIPNMDIFFFTRLDPQAGHLSLNGPLPETSSSKSAQHFEQLNS